MSDIPYSHPRYQSLKTREKITDFMKKGIVHETGLIAHGRGEAFDYLLGEKSIEFAKKSEKVAAALLLSAKKPIISINGNVAALVSRDCVDLSKITSAVIEVNLFHRDEKRMRLIKKELLTRGAEKVLGLKGDAIIPNLDHDRGICDKEGIYSSDVILVPLEDGDRCKALKKMGKKVIAIDLNPLSRTAISADVTIIDNVTRAIPNITNYVIELKKMDKIYFNKIIRDWDNIKMLGEVTSHISKRLNSLFQ
jgi:4-phosphopantoate--beta-alanine ligase